MGFFFRKQKTDAAEFCRDFYDRNLFGPDPSGGDLALTFAEGTRRFVGEADPSFLEVDLSALTEELRALRLEMIGTAWTHQSKENVALAVSEFTKAYLANIGRFDLWEAMTAYNQAVAKSTTFGADSSSRTGRFQITYLNQMRASLFDGWAAQGRDMDAAARVANRLGSETAWKAHITQGLLAAELTERLGFEDSEAAWGRLAVVAHGYYTGAIEALEGIALTD